MKKLLGLLLLPIFAFAGQHPHIGLPLDIEATGREYQAYLQNMSFLQGQGDPFSQMLDLGKRNLQWLDYMNQFRADADKLKFSNPGEAKGIPIDQPKHYSDRSILKEYADLLNEMPAEMKKVLVDGETFTKNPPIADQDYILMGKKTDKIYQYAARWLLMQPFLDELAGRRAEDIRGFYFLGKVPDLKTELSQWAQFADVKKTQYREWLTQMCYNAHGLRANCTDYLAQAEKNNQLYSFYESQLPSSQEIWQAFFDITEMRSDIDWKSQDAGNMNMPFLNPKNPKVLQFLKVNIEDEFRNSTWNFHMNFVDTGKNIAHVEFKPGVTPHVNGLAGNTITMDANSLLEEWDIRWTIRHEFGHVLGFPDCYIEFYDPNEKEIVSYQMDTTNLMCSRAGRLQDRHYQELKRVYFK